MTHTHLRFLKVETSKDPLSCPSVSSCHALRFTPGFWAPGGRSHGREHGQLIGLPLRLLLKPPSPHPSAPTNAALAQKKKDLSQKHRTRFKSARGEAAGALGPPAVPMSPTSPNFVASTFRVTKKKLEAMAVKKPNLSRARTPQTENWARKRNRRVLIRPEPKNEVQTKGKDQKTRLRHAPTRCGNGKPLKNDSGGPKVVTFRKL